MAGNNQFNPAKSGGQAGGRFASIFSSSDPLNNQQDNFQRETKNEKAYMMAPNQKTPSIELVRTNPEKAVIKDISFTSKADFRASMSDTSEKDVNYHDQFVKTDLDSPSSFGHGT